MHGMDWRPSVVVDVTFLRGAMLAGFVILYGESAFSSAIARAREPFSASIARAREVNRLFRAVRARM